MSISPDLLRGTGRTTRMLTRAADLVRQGQWVRIVGANEQHARLLRDTFLALGFTAAFRKVEFVSIDGMHINATQVDAVLVDHYAYEVMWERAAREIEKAPAP